MFLHNSRIGGAQYIMFLLDEYSAPLDFLYYQFETKYQPLEPNANDKVMFKKEQVQRNGLFDYVTRKPNQLIF